MMALRRVLSVSLVLPLIGLACGPNVTLDDDGGSNPGHIDASNVTPTIDAFTGDLGTIKGTVWAPGNAPGMVPAGHEIPVVGATVWVTTQDPLTVYAIPQETYCDQCEDPPSGADQTEADGTFELPYLVPGTYNLIIRKAQFQLAQRVTVQAGLTLELTGEQTTLPSVHNPVAGKWIPRMALAEGLWDQMEDIMAKAGMGTLDAGNSFECGSEDGIWDLYVNGSASCGGASSVKGTLNDLIGDLNLMKQYHIIFVPCSNGDNSSLFGNAVYRENIREFVKAGGKFYVTDWSAEWEDAVFPQFLVYTSDIDTTSESGPFGDGDGFSQTDVQAYAANDALKAWLDIQEGPLVGGSTGAFDGDDFEVEGNYDEIESTPGVRIGVDDDNIDIIETAYSWVRGDLGADRALTVTFEPIGCGRVLYSSYHTADEPHQGLIPQERVLLYLLMEIGVCKSGPIVD